MFTARYLLACVDHKLGNSETIQLSWLNMAAERRIEKKAQNI